MGSFSEGWMMMMMMNKDKNIGCGTDEEGK